MNKNILLGIGGLAILAAVIMYLVGKDSSHLSELADFFWVPLPLAVVCIAGGMMKGKNAS